MQRFISFFVSIILLTLCVSGLYAHESAALHYNDFKCVFEGYGDDAFRELSDIINSGIDNTLPSMFREGIGSIPGNHRVLGHGWTLNDSIPRETLNLLAERYPGREKEIISIWQKFASQLQADSVRLTGLPKAQANALASMLYDIHLLGDLEPDNTLIKQVLSYDNIILNFEKDASTLFRNNPQYAEKIQKSLEHILKSTKGKDPQIISQALMDELQRLKIGEMLNATWGNTLLPKYSPDRVAKANEQIARRMLKRIPGVGDLGLNIEKNPTANNQFFDKTDNSKIACPGLLTSDGRLLLAFKEGAETALMIVAIEGGIATYQYCSGAILKPEFEEKIKDAAIKGTVVGTAVGVTVFLGATPGGFIVLGVGTGVYYITDYVIAVWKEHQAKKYLTIDDLKAYGIELDSILEMDIDSILFLKSDSVLDTPIDSTLELPTESLL